MAGEQQVEIRSLGRADGCSTPHLRIRFGSLTIRIEDRTALASLIDVVRSAVCRSLWTFDAPSSVHEPSTHHRQNSFLDHIT
jgi:hypothetical protein